jgi:hypothetical protein
VPSGPACVQAGGPRAVDAIVEGGGELADPLEGEVGVADPDPVDLTHGFLRGPSVPNVPLRVASSEQAATSLTRLVLEAFVGHDSSRRVR